MDLEEQYALGLAVLSVVLLIVGVAVAKVLAGAPPRVIRTVWPVTALVTLGSFAIFVLIARMNVKG